MSNEKVEGFLMGLGAGLLLAASLGVGGLRKKTPKQSEDAGRPARSGPERSSTPTASASAAQA